MSSLYFHCDKCDQKFGSQSSLRSHVKQSHEGIKFTCPSCGLVFDRKDKLTKHERVTHSIDEKYRCMDCGKQFGSDKLLQIHKTRHEEPQFQCTYCPKKLKTALSLKHHERYHTGEKPFVCPECGNGYVAKEKLRQHLKGVHKIAGPKGGATGWKRNKK